VNPARNRSTIIYLLLFIIIIVMVVYNFQQSATTQEVLPINKVAADIHSGIVERIIEDEDRLRVVYTNGEEKASHKETGATLVEQLISLGVTSEELSPERIKIEIKPPSAWLGIATALGYILPFVILAGVFWFVFRQAQGSNNAALSFGKSRVVLFEQEKVVLENTAHRGVGPFFALFRSCAFAARESVPDFLLHNIGRVPREYAGFRH